MKQRAGEAAQRIRKLGFWRLHSFFLFFERENDASAEGGFASEFVDLLNSTLTLAREFRSKTDNRDGHLARVHK